MDMRGPPEVGVFLEKRSYRRRRLMDALRILPFVGIWLWLIPLFWGGGAGEGPNMSSALVYVFGVWALLVLMGAALQQIAHSLDSEQSKKQGG